MGRVAGIQVGTMSTRKSNGRKNKDVVQGSTTEEGSRFWKKLGILLCCLRLNSKKESSSNDKSKQRYAGRKVTNDVVRHQPVTSRSSTTKRSRNRARGCTPNMSHELIVASSLLRRFSFNDLKLATRNFKAENFLGEGGFGTVLKGWISQHGNYAARPGTGIPVAVKSLNLNGLQGHKEWLTEISYLSELHHPNLVKLVGFCIEDDKRLLVYEYMCRGSLEKHLFRRSLRLTWPMRLKIMIGAAKGLAFLHEEASKSVIFRDFKTSNILLDMNYDPKLSDFGLARDGPVGDATHVSTQVMGTQGYAAPEYVMTGHLTSKSDVYSFGVVLLEILTGRRAMDKSLPRREQNLVEWMRPLLKNKENFHYLMDPRLGGQYSRRGANRAMRLASHCVRPDPKARPLMSEVVRVLKSLPGQNEKNMEDPSTRSASTSTRSVSIQSSSLHIIHEGPSNHNGGANKYGLRTDPEPNVPWRFQASPLSLEYPLPPPNTAVGLSLTN
ncbi:receptor-like cytoplasmic kinase 176 [Cajanus cajan]|nr:receptor-like cytoplasmic kinase 176 [Cajanus cajan]